LAPAVFANAFQLSALAVMFLKTPGKPTHSLADKGLTARWAESILSQGPPLLIIGLRHPGAPASGQQARLLAGGVCADLPVNQPRHHPASLMKHPDWFHFLPAPRLFLRAISWAMASSLTLAS
jgi:hypothetical protein